MFGYQSIQASLIIYLVSHATEGKYLFDIVEDINNVVITPAGKLGWIYKTECQCLFYMNIALLFQ